MAADTPSRFLLYTGIAGALAMGVCDIILLGVPQAGWSGDVYSFSSLVQVSMQRIQIGAFAGLLSSFFICGGYCYLWQMLRRYGFRLATIMFLSFTFYGVMGGVFHMGYYFAGAAIYQGEVDLYFQFIDRLKLLAAIASAGSLLGSALYAYIIFYRQRVYSQWYAAGNLLIWQGIALVVTFILPSPIGGYLRPAFINLGTLLFFIMLGNIGANSKERSLLGKE